MRCRLSARAIPDVGAASRPPESPAPGRVTFRSACSSSWTATRGSRPAPPVAACSSTPARRRRKSACGTYPAMMRRMAAWGQGLGEGTGGARFENDAWAGAEEIRESWLGTHLLAAPRRGAGDEVAVHALTADEDLERHVDASDWEGSGGGTGRGERGSGDVFAGGSREPWRANRGTPDRATAAGNARAPLPRVGREPAIPPVMTRTPTVARRIGRTRRNCCRARGVIPPPTVGCLLRHAEPLVCLARRLSRRPPAAQSPNGQNSRLALKLKCRGQARPIVSDRESELSVGTISKSRRRKSGRIVWESSLDDDARACALSGKIV